jgi:hypothetical protein
MNRRIILPRFAAITAAMSIALLASQLAFGTDYCKWTDQNGVVHFAEKCPENIETERVEVQPPPAEDSILEAQQRSEALLSDLESRRQERAEEREQQSANRSARADSKKGKRERCLDAMVDLHNLREGEAIYFDEAGELHDQFSIHSSSYTGARTYIGDEEHKALIAQKQRVVQTDCVQSRDEIIERIRRLAARSDSQMCRNFHDRFLRDKEYDRSEEVEDLQSIEKTVLEICN